MVRKCRHGPAVSLWNSHRDAAVARKTPIKKEQQLPHATGITKKACLKQWVFPVSVALLVFMLNLAASTLWKIMWNQLGNLFANRSCTLSFALPASLTSGYHLLKMFKHNSSATVSVQYSSAVSEEYPEPVGALSSLWSVTGLPHGAKPRDNATP